MRVDPAGAPAPIQQPNASTPARPAVRPAEAHTSPLDGAAFALTAQLAQLLATVQAHPEVRPEVIQSVAARMAAGELATPEAAAETAKAMLDSSAISNAE